MIAAAVLPILVFAGVLVNRAAMNEQASMVRTMHDAARSAASDLDRRIESLMSLALTVGDARTLRTDDLPSFFSAYRSNTAWFCRSFP